jgi:hypothetical protein
MMTEKAVMQKQEKLVLKFGHAIKQISETEVEVEVGPQIEPFTDQFAKEVIDHMGVIAGERMLDEAAHDLMVKQVVAGIR